MNSKKQEQYFYKSGEEDSLSKEEMMKFFEEGERLKSEKEDRFYKEARELLG